MRHKFFMTLAFMATLCLGTSLKEAQCASVRMKVVVLNPSATLTQSKDVRTPLPKEIMAKDVKDDGGMTIEYDNTAGAFVAIKNGILLEPGETKVFEVLMDDVWMVNEDGLDTMRKRTQSVIKGMRDTKAYERASLIGESMYARMDQILRNQNNANVTSNAHIAFYRDNLKILEQLQKDLKVKISRVEVWHNEENAQMLEEIDLGKCGGVPFFFNKRTKKWLCGAQDYETVKAWALGK